MPVTDEEVQRAYQVLEHQARKLAGRGLPAGISEEDLQSAGGLALARAVQQFDPQLGFPFAHYAARCVRGAMLEEVRKQARRNKRQQPLEAEDDEGRRTVLLPDGRAADPSEVAEVRELVAPRKKRSTVVLTQVRAGSPADAEVAQMVARLRLAMFGGVSEQDVAAVMKGLVERARQGNVPAARLLLDYIAGGRTGCTMQQAVIVHPPGPDDLA